MYYPRKIILINRSIILNNDATYGVLKEVSCKMTECVRNGYFDDDYWFMNKLLHNYSRSVTQTVI
jgi:hypothetical protein